MDLVRHFETGEVFVVCEFAGEKRIWPRESWFHLVPYHGADAPSGSMVRPFTLVQLGLGPRAEDTGGQLAFGTL